LSGLPQPDIEVPAFKRRLRGDLLNTRPAPPGRSPGLALGVAFSTAALLALVLVVFVLSPSVPARVHAALIDDDNLQPDTRIPIQEFLRTTNASAELDLAFIEDWSARQARPVQVRSMEAEKIYAVRQFELTNGKRMIVFTELGPEPAERQVAQARVPEQVL